MGCLSHRENSFYRGCRAAALCRSHVTRFVSHVRSLMNGGVFVKRISLVLVFCTLALFAVGSAFYFNVEGQHHSVSKQSGPLTNATVSFGAWMTNPPIDRFPNNTATRFPRFANHHAVIPEVAKIKAGGSVNFIIGGFHVVAIYDDGTQPGDINTNLTILPAIPPVPPGAPPGPPIIDDPNRRIYRGLDPTLLPLGTQQDRVEVVNFDRPGTYLVICAVLPHFAEGMYGYVRVLPAGSEE
jgi:plastocyanin